LESQREDNRGHWRRSLAAWSRKYGVVAAMVTLVTLMHYNTAIHLHEAHGIYRRLYYFPIIIAAFYGGLRAGLITAVVICLAYVPHAFGGIGFDPAPTLEKILEMVLYLAVATVSGILVDRGRAARADLEATARNLRRTLDEKSAMERELVRRERLAAVGRLSAGLAHEIRNPLASIKGAADVLADDFTADHPRGRLLRVMQEETARLNRVLTRFLSFARSGRGQPIRCDLGAEIAAVADLVSHGEAAPLVAVDLPDTGTLELVANREEIRQLLMNLLLNATAAAGRQGRVRVAARREGETLLCVVEDDGPGFDAEALANFGVPFFSTREGGTGLGLATCARVVDDHGGSLRVDTTFSEGARLVVRLPAASRPPEVT
jgi:signal transduction histidine kinase